MASIKNKTEFTTALAKVPVCPITVTFKTTLKESSKGVVINDKPLSDVVNHSITIERLKGFQYTSEFAALSKWKYAEYYELEACYVHTKWNESSPVKTTLRTLTDGVSLITFMLNNGPKLYLSDYDRKTRGFSIDRNYSEIMIGFYDKDGRNPLSCRISPLGSKLMKDDIKTLAIANDVVTEESHKTTSINTTAQAILALPGMAEKIAQRTAKLKELAEAKKKQRLLEKAKLV